MGIHKIAVVLLVVCRKMLNCCPFSIVPLYSLRDSRRHPAADQRIFRIILKISAAEWIPVYVHRRCKPQINMELFHFLPDHAPSLFYHLPVPGLCKRPANRNCRTVLVIVRYTFFGTILKRRYDISHLFSSWENSSFAVCLKMWLQPQSCRPVSQNQPPDSPALRKAS